MSAMPVRSVVLSAVAAMAAAVLATSAAARELRLEPALSCQHDVNVGYKHLAEELPKRTGGELTVRNYCGSLLGLSEVSDGLRDGVLDIGLMVLPYWPAEFKYNNFLANLSGLSDTAVAMTGANTEFVLSCEPCKQEFLAKNQLVLGMFSNPPYVPIVARKPMKKPEDLVGKKFRAGSIYFRRWAEYFKGKAVSMTGNEIYEGLNAGVLDATLSTPTEIPNFGLQDVVGSVTNLSIGTFHSMTLFPMNLDTWRSLSPAQRQVVLDLAAEGTAATVTRLDEQYAEIFDQLAEWKIELIEPSPELVDMNEQFAARNVEEVAGTAEKEYGIPNGPELAERFAQTAARWNELVKGIDRFDWKQVADLYKREIYSKIDVNSYGM